jgi:hypothetical protein
MSSWIPPSSPPEFETMTADDFEAWVAQSDPLEVKWYKPEIAATALRLNASPVTGEPL